MKKYSLQQLINSVLMRGKNRIHIFDKDLILDGKALAGEIEPTIFNRPDCLTRFFSSVALQRRFQRRFDYLIDSKIARQNGAPSQRTYYRWRKKGIIKTDLTIFKENWETRKIKKIS